ncbi:unnamed protein product [Miscanthus lutarioriparius]|uniref:Uncharacterized protein n=1 Tax=Miscanthus lutarioriparius TaxID=422564 RepID=A0A811RPZ0_9POAL|nr:unnamed protein product [Miscanthus lutarioriparius]
MDSNNAAAAAAATASEGRGQLLHVIKATAECVLVASQFVLSCNGVRNLGACGCRPSSPSLVRGGRRAHVVRQAAGCAGAAAASPARQGAVAEARCSGTGVPCPQFTNLAYGLPDGYHFAI